MATKVKASAPAPSLGAQIDFLWGLKQQKKDLEAQMKEVEERISEAETALMERLDSEKMDKATSTKATVSISTMTVADVTDWDAFWAYVLKSKYTHLLQRRVSDPAYRELLEAGKKVPGVQPFPKRRLNMRTV